MDMPADEIYEKVMNSGIYEKGIEQGFEDGKNEALRENVISMSEFGVSAEDIAGALKLDLEVINEILADE